MTMRHNANNILCENDVQHDVARKKKEKKKNVQGKLKAVQCLSGDPFLFFSAEVFQLISLTSAAPLTLAKTTANFGMGF